ncbi:MAG: TrmH family RNA methyltransferase [Patescibacteria group bacterium]
MMQIMHIVAIIHNVRSLHNVGSILRTSDAVGISRVYMTGYTPSPLDEMGRVRKEVAKTALGAERTVVWKKEKSLSRLTNALQKEGYSIVGLEYTDGAENIQKVKITKPIALIVGNEVRGISRALLKRCDRIVFIPMRGSKESLNVSVAFGVAAYELLRDY